MPFLIAGHQTLAVAASAVGLTIPTPTNGKVIRVYLSVLAADIRWRADGTNPTASVGHLEESGSEFEIDGATNLANFKAIRTGAVSAELNIIFYKEE